MLDPTPEVLLGLEDGRPVVIVGDGEATDLPGLIALAPGLLRPAAARQAARAVNHLARGSAFVLIEDPEAWASATRARLASEDPQASWSPGVARLSDFGVPVFEAIRPPALVGSVLSFFAADATFGLPYAVRVDLRGGADPAYEPMELTPIGGGGGGAGVGGSGIVDEDSEEPAPTTTAPARENG